MNLPIDLPPSDGAWSRAIAGTLLRIFLAFDCVLAGCGCDDLLP